MKPLIEFPNRMVLDRFETAAGRDIPNYQEHSIMDYGSTEARWERHKKQFPSATARTKKPTGVYNCHGFIFGAGRTGIDDPQDVRMILNDDGYVRIDAARSLEGDVVLYVGEDGDVEHSAILVVPGHKAMLSLPVVVSKWGNFTEYVHELHACPYNATNIEYWRIEERPRIPPSSASPQCLIQL